MCTGGCTVRISGGGLSFWAQHWGDVASVVGLAMTLVTLRLAAGAKKAAEQARARISVLDTISMASAAIALLDEIKRVQRSLEWALVLHLYSSLRKSLVAIQHARPESANPLGTALTQIRVIEDSIERALAKSQPSSLNVADFNRIVSVLIDDLGQVLATMRKAGT